jgi:predicted RND superfamily exporter protein
VQGESRFLAAFGLWAAAGTALAYVLTFTLGPALLAPGGRRRAMPRWPGRLAAAIVELSVRHRRAALAAWGLLLLAAALGAARVRVDVRYPDVFAPGEPVAREVRAVKELLGTDLLPLEILLAPTDEHGRAALPLASAALAVSHYLRTLPETRLVLPRDLLDLGTVDPRQAGATVEQLAADPRVAPWVRLDRGAVRVQAHFAPLSFARREEILGWLRHFDATVLSHHRLTLGGPAYTYQVAERRGVRGALVGGGLSLLAIAVALAWAFRRPRVVAAALAGNLAPLLVVAGLMGALGVPWSLAVLPLPAVLLGLAVDDTLHLLWPLRAGRRRLVRGALRAGPPALATTAVLAGSVATLAFSGLAPNRELGLLLAAGLVLALACDLSLVPALATSSGRRSAPPPR